MIKKPREFRGMHSIPTRVEKSIHVRQSVGLRAYAVSLILAGPAAADDWPFFRGPHYNGVSAEAGWTCQWPAEGPKVAWRTDVGIGAPAARLPEERLS
jgi:hypothetical protein